MANELAGVLIILGLTALVLVVGLSIALGAVVLAWLFLAAGKIFRHLAARWPRW